MSWARLFRRGTQAPRSFPNPPRADCFWEEWAARQHHWPDSVFLSLPAAQYLPGLLHATPSSGPAHISQHILEPYWHLLGSTSILFTFLESFTVHLPRPGPSTGPMGCPPWYSKENISDGWVFGKWARKTKANRLKNNDNNKTGGDNGPTDFEDEWDLFYDELEDLFNLDV